MVYSKSKPLITATVNGNTLILETAKTPRHAIAYFLSWGKDSKTLSKTRLQTRDGRSVTLSSAIKQFQQALKASEVVEFNKIKH